MDKLIYHNKNSVLQILLFLIFSSLIIWICISMFFLINEWIFISFLLIVTTTLITFLNVIIFNNELFIYNNRFQYYKYNILWFNWNPRTVYYHNIQNIEKPIDMHIQINLYNNDRIILRENILFHRGMIRKLFNNYIRN